MLLTGFSQILNSFGNFTKELLFSNGNTFNLKSPYFGYGTFKVPNSFKNVLESLFIEVYWDHCSCLFFGYL